MAAPNFSSRDRTQAMWEKMESTDKPSSSQPMSRSVARTPAKAMSSEAHTGVKSAGCEKNTSQLPRKSSRRRMPWVVSASKSGAVSPMRGTHTEA